MATHKMSCHTPSCQKWLVHIRKWENLAIPQTLSSRGFFNAPPKGARREGGRSGDTPETPPGAAPLDPAKRLPPPDPRMMNLLWLIATRGNHAPQPDPRACIPNDDRRKHVYFMFKKMLQSRKSNLLPLTISVAHQPRRSCSSSMFQKQALSLTQLP